MALSFSQRAFNLTKHSGDRAPFLFQEPQAVPQTDDSSLACSVHGGPNCILLRLDQNVNKLQAAGLGIDIGAKPVLAHLEKDSCHPYTIQTDVYWMVTIMADNVHQLRPKPADTEKITINLGYVALVTSI